MAEILILRFLFFLFGMGWEGDDMVLGFAA